MTRVIDDDGRPIDLSSSTAIPNNSVTNAKLADMPDQRVKGNVAGATGDPQDLTRTQVRALAGVGDLVVTDTPTNPASGEVRLVVGTDHVLRWRDSAGNMYAATDASTAAALAAHLDETDPFVHTAPKIYSGSSVGTGNVEDDLTSLNATKADATAMATADALKLNVADALMVSSGVAQVNLNNITINTDTNLFSFTLPANTLNSNGDMLILDAEGDMLANSGTPTFTWKMKNGSVTLATPAVSPAVSANQRRWILRVRIRRTNSNAAQSMAAKLLISQAIATTQWNVFDSALCFSGHVSDFAATDFTVASTISFSVAMSVQNANNRFRMYGYEAYKVRAA